MPIKSVKMKISKNKKMRFFLMSQGSLDPKIRFLCQKVCSVARVQTDTQTRKWIQRTSFQGFRNFSFNLSSRIGSINIRLTTRQNISTVSMGHQTSIFPFIWYIQTYIVWPGPGVAPGNSQISIIHQYLVLY